MRIAVTGASGFVGGAVCRAAAAGGDTVHAFGRRRHVDAAHVGHAGYVSWDIAGGPLSAPPQVDAVIHCAGSVTDWAAQAELAEANIVGTANVLATFAASAKFVHVSTASVYDPLRPTVGAAETTALPRNHPDAYGRTKAAAEQLVAGARPNAIILRPHAVYGPGDTTLLPRVQGAVRRTAWGPRLIAVGDGRQLISVTSIGNLVQACLLAAASSESGIFNIADPEPIALDDVLRAFLAERAVPATPCYVPARIALALAVLVEGAARAARRKNPPALTRYAVRHLAVERTLDISAARRRLGYNPTPTSLVGASGW